jgi:hypothetical protein
MTIVAHTAGSDACPNRICNQKHPKAPTDRGTVLGDNHNQGDRHVDAPSRRPRQREPFIELVETGEMPKTATHRGQQLTIRRLMGPLWNCTDTMPGDLYDELGL